MNCTLLVNGTTILMVHCTVLLCTTYKVVHSGVTVLFLAFSHKKGYFYVKLFGTKFIPGYVRFNLMVTLIGI